MMTRISDDLTIPDFLRISAKDRARHWVDNPPRATQFVPDTDRQRELREQQERAKSARKIEKLKQCLAKKNDRGAKPKDYDPARHRWNPAKGRFEIDPFVLLQEKRAEEERRANSPLIEMRERTSGATDARSPALRPAKQRDELTERATAFTPAQLTKFAKANDCWDDKYDRLPNPGLVRMNVLNRLRAKVRKGYTVQWT